METQSYSNCGRTLQNVGSYRGRQYVKTHKKAMDPALVGKRRSTTYEIDQRQKQLSLNAARNHAIIPYVCSQVFKQRSESKVFYFDNILEVLSVLVVFCLLTLHQKHEEHVAITIPNSTAYNMVQTCSPT